jgi:hypothetical protein
MPPIDAMQVEVERRMRRGERFADVEELINASPLTGEEKSALWLLGWSYLDRRAQRREARAHLHELSLRTEELTVKRRWRLHAVV